MEAHQLYEYGSSTLCDVEIRPVFRDPEVENPELVEPTEEELGTPIYHKVHSGYRPFITGAIREIDFMIKDELTNHNCLFRATYLTMILDLFADDLQKRIRSQMKSRFRSRALNPILQRQMRGVTDYEARSVNSVVGDTLDESIVFYLKQDPLDRSNRITMLHRSLYVWPVRLSYASLQHEKITEGFFQHSLANTQALYASYTRDGKSWTAGKLTSNELKIICQEKTQDIYQDLLTASVSSLPPAFNRFSSKF